MRNVVVGVCGGISSYKTCELVRLLKKDEFCVKVVMTGAATEFVRPLVFGALSGNSVHVEMFGASENGIFKGEGEVEHISLAQWADIFIIAPLSANTLSKISHGICDNLLTSVICALPEETKIMCAPAMNENMWNNSFIQENIKKIKNQERYIVLTPGEGSLACGVSGPGRMPEAKTIFETLKNEMREGDRG